MVEVTWDRAPKPCDESLLEITRTRQGPNLYWAGNALRRRFMAGPNDGDEGRFNDVERELEELREQLRRASEHPFRRGETRSIRLLEERLREMQGRLVQSLQQNER